MKKINKKVLTLLLSIVLIFSAVPLAGIASAVNEVHIDVADIDTSNPYDYDHYINEPVKNISKNRLFSIQNNEEINTKSSNYPTSYDSRDYGYVTPVKNQYSTGTCWAHAAMSAIESYEIVNHNVDIANIDLAESHLSWFAWNPNSNGANGANDGSNIGASAYTRGGNWRYVALALGNREGINSSADYPLAVSTDFSSMEYNESQRYDHSEDIGLKDIILINGADDIKEAVLYNGSVVCAFYYNSSNLSHKTINNLSHYAYYCPTATTINHSVTIIGWDDNFPKEYFNTAPQNNGAWLIKDSWGTASKEQGYFWLSYEDKSMAQCASYSTVDDFDSFDNYSYTSALFMSTATGITTYGSVYKATKEEKIKYIGIYNTSGAVTAKVSVYKNIPLNGAPGSGTLSQSVTRTLPADGYYTFEFTTPVVNANERFGVVVEMSNGSTYSVPMETSAMGSFTCNAGESYLKLGSTWIDLSSQGYGNTYIFVWAGCNHNYQKEKDHVEDCTKGGKIQISCTKCGKIAGGIVYPPKAKHNLVTEHVDASCVDGGYEYSYCTNCDYTNREEFASLGHHWVEERVEETCTTQGHSKTYCDRCGEVSFELYWGGGGHTIVDDPRVEPTCSSFGHTSGKHCSVCGYVLVPCDLLQPLPHTPVTDEGRPVSCTEDGLTEGAHCAVCGEILEPQQVIHGYGSHDYKKVDMKAPTCTEDGYNTYSCIRCYHTYTDIVPALGHEAGEEVTYEIPATCTQDGAFHREIRCIRCDEVLYSDYTIIPATGHTPVTVAGKAATCTEGGYTSSEYCSVCGETLVGQTPVSALGHNYKSTKVTATCEQDGYVLHKCSRCNHSYVTNYVKAKGHNWGPAIQTGGGSYKHTCKNCGITQHYQVKSQFEALKIRIQTFIKTLFRRW